MEAPLHTFVDGDPEASHLEGPVRRGQADGVEQAALGHNLTPEIEYPNYFL